MPAEEEYLEDENRVRLGDDTEDEFWDLVGVKFCPECSSHDEMVDRTLTLVCVQIGGTVGYFPEDELEDLAAQYGEAFTIVTDIKPFQQALLVCPSCGYTLEAPGYEDEWEAALNELDRFKQLRLF